MNGTQAELVRVPFADHSVHKLPYAMDRDTAVLFSEVLPAAFELGVRNGKVRPGAVVVVVGAGPVGLSALIIAGIYSPARVISVDLSPRAWPRRAASAPTTPNSPDVSSRTCRRAPEPMS